MISVRNRKDSSCFPTQNRKREINEKAEDPNEAPSPIQTVPKRDPNFLEFFLCNSVLLPRPQMLQTDSISVGTQNKNVETPRNSFLGFRV